MYHASSTGYAVRGKKMEEKVLILTKIINSLVRT